MKPEMLSTPTRLVAMCLGPKAGGGFDIREVPRRKPGPDEVEIAVEAASINPIDVRRAAGYGRSLLSLMGASRFPMTLGNDFAGVVAAVGSGRASGFAIGERVYGVKPPSRDGTHASHVLVKAAHASKAPANRELQELAALPYCFVTMWLAAAQAGVTRQNAEGKEIPCPWRCRRLGNAGLADPLRMGSARDRHRQGVGPARLPPSGRGQGGRTRTQSIRKYERRVRRDAQLRHVGR